MRPISDKAMDDFETTALMGSKAVREFLAYQGDNKKFLDRAKIGVTAISGYARLRASESGRMQVELIGGRVIEATRAERKRIAS